jgi:hypothetical protein
MMTGHGEWPPVAEPKVETTLWEQSLQSPKHMSPTNEAAAEPFASTINLSANAQGSFDLQRMVSRANSSELLRPKM